MFHSLLVPLDGSEFGERSLPMARAIARASSAALHLVQVHPPIVPAHFVTEAQLEYGGLDVEGYARQHREEAEQYLNGVADKLASEGLSVTAVVVDGRIAERIAAHAETVGADGIVMTTHGYTGLNRMWLGSVADALVRRTSVPLLLIHPAEEDPTTLELASIDHILVPLDGSELSERVVEPATQLAKLTRARLTLGHILSSHAVLGARLFPLLPDDILLVREKAETYLNEVAERLRAEGLSVEVAVVEQEAPAEAIAQMAQKIDAKLIAIATHGYGGFRRSFVGSVADKVLRSSPLPLLVLRPES